MDRVMEASRAAAGTPGAGDIRDGDTYLRMIDGMVYGDSPSRGFVRGRVFANPDDNIVWEAPPDFVLQRVGEQLVAAGPGDTRILYDTAELGRPVPPLTFLTEMWAANVPLEAVERLEINGFPAATGVFRARTQSGPRDVRPVVIEIAPGRFGRFIFITWPELTGRVAEALRRTTYSYRPLTPAERAALSARRIEVVTVQPGDTIRSLAQRMAFDDYRLERFLALNALDPDDPLEPGRKVKLVVK
jgi:predicted Zn-dependent protease